METTVWVDDWQLQCCGEPFSVGSRVRWHLVASDPDSLGEVLGEEAAARVPYAEEHHGSESGDPVEAVVRSIDAVHHRLRPSPENPQWLVHVEDSTVLRPVQRADGREPESDGLSFRGYLVEVELGHFSVSSRHESYSP
ncbi:DUF6578 domain-containing protein [Amycolatopsis sp. NPDC004378]